MNSVKIYKKIIDLLQEKGLDTYSIYSSLINQGYEYSENAVFASLMFLTNRGEISCCLYYELVKFGLGDFVLNPCKSFDMVWYLKKNMEKHKEKSKTTEKKINIQICKQNQLKLTAKISYLENDDDDVLILDQKEAIDEQKTLMLTKCPFTLKNITENEKIVMLSCKHYVSVDSDNYMKNNSFIIDNIYFQKKKMNFLIHYFATYPRDDVEDQIDDFISYQDEELLASILNNNKKMAKHENRKKVEDIFKNLKLKQISFLFIKDLVQDCPCCNKIYRFEKFVNNTYIEKKVVVIN